MIWLIKSFIFTCIIFISILIASGYSSVIDLVSDSPVYNGWLDFGYVYLNDRSWVSITSLKDDYRSAVIFVSLPDVSNHGNVTFMARIRNRVTNGNAKFEAKLFQANDSFCSKNWYIPSALPSPVQVAWLVAEQGAYNVSGSMFLVNSGNISRDYAEPSASIVKYLYAPGCDSPDTACRYSSDTVVGVISQLQTVVYERLVVPRLVVANLFFAKFLLQSHDSMNEAYLVMTEPEVMAVLAFPTGRALHCTCGISFETEKIPAVTSDLLFYTYGVEYGTFPGVFGTISSFGIGDFTSLGVFGTSPYGVALYAQEDQCADEEISHTAEYAFVFVAGEAYIDSSERVECGVNIVSTLSGSPSVPPSQTPSIPPTPSPSAIPTDSPSYTPSSEPTFIPSFLPTPLPTFPPTELPSLPPSAEPTSEPSAMPSFCPSSCPTRTPSSFPTDHPSTSPTSNPSSFPTWYPSTCPSTLPTVLPSAFPTRSDTLAFFKAFDSSKLLDSVPDLWSNESNTEKISFAYYINTADDIPRVESEWGLFVDNYLRTPFDVDNFRLFVWVSFLQYGSSMVRQYTHSCEVSQISNAIISSISSTSAGFAGICDGTAYSASPYQFCSGCTSSSGSTICAPLEDGMVSIPLSSVCAPDSNDLPLSKHAVALLISSRELVKETVPVLNLITSLPGRVTISVTANVTTSLVGGSIYCKAFSESNANKPTRALLKSSGASATIPRGSGFVVVGVELLDVVASTAYDIFCHTVDSLGNEMNADSMVASMVSVSTLCCRELVFTAAPLTVDTDEPYESVFIYEIPTLPAEVLTVRPIFFDEYGNSTDDVVAIPARHTFSVDNKRLGRTRSFLVDASGMGRNFSVGLNISGMDKEKYSAPYNVPFQLTHFESTLPAPSLKSARFSNSGGTARVCFTSGTDYGQHALLYDFGNPWVCSLIFSFNGDTKSSCSWVNSACLDIQFCGNDLCNDEFRNEVVDLLVPGDLVTLRAGIVRAVCPVDRASKYCIRNAAAREQSLYTTGPASPLKPSVFISMNKPGGECGTDLRLDASSSYGDGGRPWESVVWSVSATNRSDNVDNIQSLLRTWRKLSVVIPYNMLGNELYSFSLQLGNFLQNGTTGVSFSSVQVDSRLTGAELSISFDGSSFRLLKSFDEFRATVTYTPPGCISANMSTYSWKVFKGIVYQPNLVSSSTSPTVMRLPPYSFEPGQSYRIIATVSLENGASGSAILAVVVESSSVYLSIRGASFSMVAPSSEITLDASDSVVEDISPDNTLRTSIPSVSWSCLVLKSRPQYPFNYNDECLYLFDSNSLVDVPANVLMKLRTDLMRMEAVYRFTVSAFSSSGEYVSSSVDIAVGNFTAQSAPTLSILSSFRKFNRDRILRIPGLISPHKFFKSDGVVNISWRLFDSARNEIEFENMLSTPSQITYFGNSSLSYPLSAKPFVFTAGTIYTFRLQCTVIDRARQGVATTTFSEVTLVANGPPTSGLLSVNPSIGDAFETLYTLRALYWVDDASDYPLTYTFKYSYLPLNATSSPLALGLPNHRSYVQSLLPSGMHETVWCVVVVSDFYGAYASAQNIVSVRSALQTTLSVSTLESELTAAVALSHLNTILQIVNGVSMRLQLSDCFNAPNCSTLNRENCRDTAHTCGSCHDGFTGIPGDSNSLCVSMSSDILDIGDACETNDSCTYGFCNNGICQYDLKECPTAIPGMTCSGHGSCAYYSDISGQELSNCSTGNVYCSSRCMCDNGYYGTSCTLDKKLYDNRTKARELMCRSLRKFGDTEDQSWELVEALTSSLMSVFFVPELAGNGIDICLRVIDVIIASTESGYMRNEDLLGGSVMYSPQAQFARIISSLSQMLSFIKVSNSTNGNTSNITSTIEYYLYRATSTLTNSINSDMVAGESNLEVVTSGVRLSVHYDPIDTLDGAILSPPRTAAEVQFDAPAPSILLPPSGLKLCTDSFSNNGYVRYSVMQWGSNPIWVDSNSTANSSSAEVSSRLLRFSRMVSSRDISGYEVVPSNSEPYSIVIQFSTPLNWNESIPQCVTNRNGVIDQCPCNLTSYTPFNATFECYNLVDMCPQRESSDERRTEILHFSDSRHPHYALLASKRRRLDFDYAGEADDGSDDSSLLEYGALFLNIGVELENTLSNNPLNSRDLYAATPLLSMLSALMLVSIVGIIIFGRWDEFDCNYLRYVMRYTRDKKYKHPMKNVFNLRKAFVEKGFVLEKERGAMLNLQELSTTATNCQRDLCTAIHLSRSAALTESNDSIEKDILSVKFGVENKSLFGEPYSSTAAKDDKQYDFNMRGIGCVGHKIATFFDQALPPTSLLHQKSGWIRFVKAILREHDYVRMFTYASLRLSRTMRFLVVFTNVLILLFADSLFYGILFPPEGMCTELSNTSSQECLKEPSRFQSDENLCTWEDDSGTCAVRPPPTTIQFYAVVAILITTFSIIPQVFCQYVLEQKCAMKPIFSTDGSDKLLLSWTSSSPDNKSDSSGRGRSDVAFDDAHKLFSDDATLFVYSKDLAKLVDLYVYYDFISVREETNVLLTAVHKYLCRNLMVRPLPWKHSKYNEADKWEAANIAAIMDYLGLYHDGNPVPLTCRQRLLFGTSRRRVEWKINKVRRQANQIVDEINSFVDGMDDCRNTTLIQHFILEQLSPFRRYALKQQFFVFDNAEPDEIRISEWFAAWILMVSIWIFLVYWIFQWAVVNSGVTMLGWGYDMVFVLLQDIFINQTLQILVVHVVVIEAMRPQLKTIYAVLNDILEDKTTRYSHDDPSLNDVRVVQHMSASCRAARHRTLISLPASQLLHRINDFDVSRCRDTRGTQLHWLTVAVLAIPTALALSHETVQESVLDVLIPTLWSCFVIANAYMYEVSPVVMFLPYIVIVMGLGWAYRKRIFSSGLQYLIPQKLVSGECCPNITFKHPGEREGPRKKMETNRSERHVDVMWLNMNKQIEFSGKARDIESNQRRQNQYDDYSASLKSSSRFECGNRKYGNSGVRSEKNTQMLEAESFESDTVLSDTVYSEISLNSSGENQCSFSSSTLLNHYVPSEIEDLQQQEQRKCFAYVEKTPKNIYGAFNKFVWSGDSY